MSNNNNAGPAINKEAQIILKHIKDKIKVAIKNHCLKLVNT